MIRNKQILNLISIIESKTGWDGMQNWSDKKYNDLSDAIFESTGVKISASTLKRISGKFETPAEYEPSESTLDAISQHFGYMDWNSFQKPKNKFISLKSILILCFASVLIAASILSGKLIKRININFEDYSVEVQDSVAIAPYTAIFNYQIPNRKGVTTELEFGGFTTQPEENIRPKQKLDPVGNTISYLYTYPDYFKANLKVNNKKIKDIPVHILTKGWKAMYLTNKKTHRILLDYSPIKNGNLCLLKKQIDSLLMKTEHEQSWMYYINSDTFAFDCENIIVTTRIRNREMKEFETGCRFGEITLIGENGSMTFRICDQGCSQWIKLVAGRKRILGTKADLSKFECDMTDWQYLRIKNQNKNIEFYLQDTLIHQMQYEETVGKLKVIYYDFTVSGEVDFVEITDLENKVLYEDDFEK